MTFITRMWARYGAPYIKAHAAGLGAGLTLLVEDCNWKIANLSTLSGDQWLGIAAATGILGGLVGALRNRPAPVMAAPAASAPVVDAPSQDAGA